MCLQYAFLFFFCNILPSLVESNLFMCQGPPEIHFAIPSVHLCLEGRERCCKTGCCPLSETDNEKTEDNPIFSMGDNKVTNTDRNVEGTKTPSKKKNIVQKDPWVFVIVGVIIVMYFCIFLYFTPKKCCKRKEIRRQNRHNSDIFSMPINTEEENQREESRRNSDNVSVPLNIREENTSNQLTQETESTLLPVDSRPSAPVDPELRIGFVLERNDDNIILPNTVPLTPPPSYEDALLAPVLALRPEDRIPSYEDVMKGKAT